ncbi:Exocyst complex component SEC6 (AtSec6), partial [Durusdinium trenchii]
MQAPQSLGELAEQLAVEEIKKLFPGDALQLDRLQKLREDHERDLIAVETQLEAGVQAQLDEMENAVMLLNMARKEMARVHANFRTIHQQCQECTDAIGDFERILKVRNARVNLLEILQQLEIYDAVPKRVRELNAMLAQSPEMLKPVFSEWLHLKAWRERILAQVSDAVTEASRKEEQLKERVANWEELDMASSQVNWGDSAEANSQILVVLGEHFRKVEDLGDRIWEQVAARLHNFLDLAQFENAGLLVVAVEVVERIDRHDDRERNHRVALGEPREKLEMLLPPNKRRRDALMELEMAIEHRLDRVLPKSLLSRDPAEESGTSRGHDDDANGVDGVRPEDDDNDNDAGNDKPPVEVFLGSVSTIVLDMTVIAEDVAKCFPESYNVLGLYRWLFERRLLALMRPVWEGAQVAPGDKLRLVGWLDDYLQTVESLDRRSAPAGGDSFAGSLKKRSSVSQKLTHQGGDPSQQQEQQQRENDQNPLEEGSGKIFNEEDHRSAANIRAKELRRETENLMASYIADALQRMRDYMRAILNRSDTPSLSTDGSLQTAISVDVFQMLSHELSAVVSHGVVGRHLASFVQRGVLEVLRVFQNEQIEQLKDPMVDIPIEMCCAKMNDYELMYDLCDNALAKEISDGFDRAVSGGDTLFKDLQDELDRAGSQRIVLEIFKELNDQGVLAVLFTPKWESGAQPTAAILRKTLEDYFDHPEQGLRGWLGSELLFGRTVALCFERLVQDYVMLFMSRTTPVADKAMTITRLRADAVLFRQCFEQYLDVLVYGKVRSAEDVKAKLAVLLHISNILDDNFPQNHFDEIAAEFGPFTQQAISRLLYFRGDLSPEARQDLRAYNAELEPTTPRFDISQLAPIDSSAAAASPSLGAAAAG